jgi:hypothetical protein
MRDQTTHTEARRRVDDAMAEIQRRVRSGAFTLRPPEDEWVVDNQRWRRIARSNGHWIVSEQGQVASGFTPHCPIAQIPDAQGRLCVQIPNRSGVRCARIVAELVLEAFVGLRPRTHTVLHLNGDADDVRLDNLRWASRPDAVRHQRAIGALLRGEAHPNAKLSEQDVRSIRAAFASGAEPAALATKFDVSTSTIAAILSGRRWSHVT